MKFEVTFKDPDGPADCIRDAVKDSLRDLGLDDEETEALVEKREEKLRKWCNDNFFSYGEYVTIVIDTDAGTATVKPEQEVISSYA